MVQQPPSPETLQRPQETHAILIGLTSLVPSTRTTGPADIRPTGFST